MIESLRKYLCCMLIKYTCNKFIVTETKNKWEINILNAAREKKASLQQKEITSEQGAL